MIYQTINTPEQFAEAFNNSPRAGDFTHDALRSLFEYFEHLDTDLKLDPIAISCEWTEYTTEELEDAYSHILHQNSPQLCEITDEGERAENMLNTLEQYTTILSVGTGYVVQEF